MKIVFLDDHDEMRASTSALLEDMGHDVVQVSSIAEVRALLEGGVHFDVALLDYRLCDGRGVDLVPEIRLQRPAAKVVLLSGTGMWDLREIDADLVLEKGMDPVRMVARLERVRMK